MNTGFSSEVMTFNSSSKLIQHGGLNLNPAEIAFSFGVSSFVVISNGFVLIFLYKLKDNKMKRRFSNILCLSFSDVVVGISGFGISVTRVFEGFHKVGGPTCAVVTFLAEFGATASFFHTFCICFERLLAVCRKTLNKDVLGYKGRIYLLVISWIVIGLLFGCLKIVTPSDIDVCSLQAVYGEYHHIIQSIISFAVLMPLLVGTVLIYGATLLILKSRMNQIDVNLTRQKTQFTMSNMHNESHCSTENRETTRSSNNMCDPQSVNQHLNQKRHETGQNKLFANEGIRNCQGENRKMFPAPQTQHQSVLPHKINVQSNTTGSVRDNFKFKAMKTIGLIVLCFIFTTGVGMGLVILYAVCNNCDLPGQLIHMAVFLVFLNSAINPLLYFCTIQPFREALKRKVTCQGN